MARRGTSAVRTGPSANGLDASRSPAKDPIPEYRKLPLLEDLHVAAGRLVHAAPAVHGAPVRRMQVSECAGDLADGLLDPNSRALARTEPTRGTHVGEASDRFDAPRIVLAHRAKVVHREPGALGRLPGIRRGFFVKHNGSSRRDRVSSQTPVVSAGAVVVWCSRPAGSRFTAPVSAACERPVEVRAGATGSRRGCGRRSPFPGPAR